MKSVVEACFCELKSSVTSFFSHYDFDISQHFLKGDLEVVTQIDRSLEKHIVGVIQRHFSEHSIIAEEGTRIEGMSDYTWYVDPIDNTVGLVAGESEVSVSVCLKEQDRHIRSFVFSPRTRDLFEADGDVAFKNGVKITVSACDLFERTRGISTCSYVNKANLDRWGKIMEVLLLHRLPLRMSGGAALDLCRVADGTRVAHISLGAHPWDIEAGIHLVKGAGGIVEVLNEFPERNSKAFIACATEEAHSQLRGLLGGLLTYGEGECTRDNL